MTLPAYKGEIYINMYMAYNLCTLTYLQRRDLILLPIIA